MNHVGHELGFVFNGDCLEHLKTMDNASVQAVITSPPYDDLRDYEGYSWDFEAIAKELIRIINDDGVIVWIVGDQVIKGSESGSSFKQALKFMELGLKLHDTMIYQKNSSAYCARPTSKRYTQIFEYMFVFCKDKPKANLICDKKNKWAGHRDWSGKMKNPVREYSPRTNIWQYVTSFNGWKHPAPFPIELAKDHIKTWTDEMDVVCDPFMGSGTTAQAAIELNRRFVGMEISSSYCDMIDKRINPTRRSDQHF